MPADAAPLHELITLEELTQRVGLSVRNVRFYTTRGLVPPPIRQTLDHYPNLSILADQVSRLRAAAEQGALDDQRHALAAQGGAVNGIRR